MDKLLRRTRTAERQVARRLARQERIDVRLRRTQRRETESRSSKEITAQLRDAARARRESWEMGPLAPYRGAPVVNESAIARERRSPVQWGSISPSRAHIDYDLSHDEQNARCAWAGGVKYLCLKKNDRVAVIEGHMRGKIGVLTDVTPSRGVVSIREISKVNVTVPHYMLPEEMGRATVQPLEADIPISAVRLVYPLPDEKTGRVRDAVITELKPIHIHHDRPTQKTTWSRIIPGLNIEIPWPEEEPEKFQDYAVDSLRIDVEEKTFVPTLLRPPMPDTVINELRNQYSKFRTRHTDEYIVRKELEEAEKRARHETVKIMRTPLQEYNVQQRELRRSRGQPELSDEMLEKIGEVMARNRHRTQRVADLLEADSPRVP
ncbi:hypothetical protein VTK73DRAFT_8 [Phialemonium thermophilum]|uniref:KOW domain-containing protein n=1 Tax=Phialemonium thermophilum TaxID=223376 RepID=A0ABR3YA23_9PEZI